MYLSLFLLQPGVFLQVIVSILLLFSFFTNILQPITLVHWHWLWQRCSEAQQWGIQWTIHGKRIGRRCSNDGFNGYIFWWWMQGGWNCSRGSIILSHLLCRLSCLTCHGLWWQQIIQGECQCVQLFAVVEKDFTILLHRHGPWAQNINPSGINKCLFLSSMYNEAAHALKA